MGVIGLAQGGAGFALSDWDSVRFAAFVASGAAAWASVLFAIMSFSMSSSMPCARANSSRPASLAEWVAAVMILTREPSV